MGNAVILAEGVYSTTYGKTANGLIRYSKRYRIVSVIDSKYAGKDAGAVLTGRINGIPIISTISEARKTGADTIIVGAATDGGFLPKEYRPFIAEALRAGMDVVSGLHEFISDDPEFSRIAKGSKSSIIDVRKMFRDRKDPFTGGISEVSAFRIAVLGTDSAIGKRTTAIILNNRLNDIGRKSVMIGTGQTSWMQGFPYTVVVDSMINDFIPGGLESVTLEAWRNERPEFMFIEGQGSVLHPAYPGSFEIIGACRPDAIILQHAPARHFFDGFESFPIPDLSKYIAILELLSDRKVIAISLNRENMTDDEVEEERAKLEKRFGIPVFDPLGSTDNVISRILEK
jgi:uncharacterized NAD-dependent epimerase/dehydratase family protein